MSELWICREQTAGRPFRLEGPGVEIRTMEELCFYLYQNIENLDESVFGEPLFLWLSRELKLPRLAAALQQEQKQGRSAFWCAWFLLKETGMYSEEELKEHKALCLAMDSKDEFECRKLKADRLFANRKYMKSIREYRRLLETAEAKTRYPVLTGNILHNLGVVHARLFLFREAAEYFEQAYELNQRPESRQAYEDALRLSRKQEPPGESDSTGEQDWNGYLEELRNDYKKKVT